MKRIILAFAFMLAFSGLTFAQTSPAKTTTTTHTKKDGTADKRFKENKAKPAVHTKKDGTPDKRFKENKPKTPATK
ncbi:MAG TPA: hypothetical protein VHZ50_00730 [Puia sp.]|nr:hypothetical protein [Puia sp.]